MTYDRFYVPKAWQKDQFAWWDHVDECSNCSVVYNTPRGYGETTPVYDSIVADRGLDPVMNKLVSELGGVAGLKYLRNQLIADGLLQYYEPDTLQPDA
jgi:hypothetical protein